MKYMSKPQVPDCHIQALVPESSLPEEALFDPTNKARWLNRNLPRIWWSPVFSAVFSDETEYGPQGRIAGIGTQRSNPNEATSTVSGLAQKLGDAPDARIVVSTREKVTDPGWAEQMRTQIEETAKGRLVPVTAVPPLVKIVDIGGGPGLNPEGLRWRVNKAGKGLLLGLIVTDTKEAEARALFGGGSPEEFATRVRKFNQQLGGELPPSSRRYGAVQRVVGVWSTQEVIDPNYRPPRAPQDPELRRMVQSGIGGREGEGKNPNRRRRR